MFAAGASFPADELVALRKHLTQRPTADDLAMAKIQDDILEKFFADLESTDGFTKERVDALRTLFAGAKKPKATDFVRVLKDQPKDQQLP